MTSDAYHAAWGTAAKFAAAPHAREYTITRGLPDALPDFRNAIYIACDAGGAVTYVGSSIRPVRRRLGEHFRDRERAATWKTLWVLPLEEDLPAPLVRLCEARVGRMLKPHRTRRLPKC